MCVLYNTCVVLPAMFRCIHTYLTILVSFDCVDTKIADRREVQYQEDTYKCNKTHIVLYKCNEVPHI